MVTLVVAYSTAVLAILIGASAFGGRPFVVRHIRIIAWSVAAGLFGALIIQTFAQYRVWEAMAPQKFLLPPYRGIGYFAAYAGWRFFSHYALSGAIGLLFFYLARWYNRRHGGEFFYDEECYVIALSILLTGNPGWLFYLLVVSFSAVVIIFFRSVILHRAEKFSLYALWFPLALFVILMSKWAFAFPFPLISDMYFGR